MASTMDLRLVGVALAQHVPALSRRIKLDRLTLFPPTKSLNVSLHPYGSVSISQGHDKGSWMFILHGFGRPQATVLASNPTDALAHTITLLQYVAEQGISSLDNGRLSPSHLLGRDDLARVLSQLDSVRKNPITL